MCHECINVPEVGVATPKFSGVLVRQWLNPLSRFLDPPLLLMQVN